MTVGLTCKLFILVVLVTMTSAAPLEEIERILEDLLLLEEFAEKRSGTANLKICDLDPSIMAKLKMFRFRKNKTNAAITMKIQIDHECLVVQDEFLEDIDPDALGKALPAYEPRYVAYSYTYQHDDGRLSYPLLFIFSSPTGTKPELQMTYAGTKNHVVKEGQFTKVFEVRNPEEINQEWVDSKLRQYQ